MKINPEDTMLVIDGKEITPLEVPITPIPWPPIEVGDNGKLQLEDGRIVRFTVYQIETVDI